METRDISSTLSELETGDISTSLATDLSISVEDESESDRRRNRHDRKGFHQKQQSKITKQLIERKQMIHDLQLLKIELSQKNLIIDNLKAEQVSKVEELEERLADAAHQKQILQAKLEAQLNIHKQDSRQRQQRLQSELDAIVKRQQQLERTNAQLQRRAGDVRSVLRDLELSETDYIELRALSEEELSLRDYVAVKLYDKVRPLQIELTDLRGWNSTLEQQVNTYKEDLARVQQTLSTEHNARSEAETKCQRLTLELADTKASIQQGDYKRENYDRIKSERDHLEHDYMELKKQHTYLDAMYKNTSSEKEDVAKQLSTVNQELSLLRQDKDYLHRQLSDLTGKYNHTDSRLRDTVTDLENAKRAREELYEKYVESRDRYKAEYESRLREELEAIRLRTDTEVDKLKKTTREMFERENRNLRENRDAAISEKDRAVAAEKECSAKYEQLLADLRQLQMTSDSKTSELLGEVRMHKFEAERAHMLQEEALQNLDKMQVELDKLRKKIQVLTKEYYSLQTSSERKSTELEAQISELRAKLDIYEKLEKELDDVVMQAAESDNDEMAERVLFSYGYGANVPSTAKRRLQHSVHLARRVLQLERINTSLKKELENNKTQMHQLGEELSSATSLLDQAQQPYNYLIESIRSRDHQINKHKTHITALEEDIGRLKKEQEELIQTRNQMSADLERLLNQREEMAVMKQVVLNLSQRYQPKATGSHPGPVHIEKVPNQAKMHPFTDKKTAPKLTKSPRAEAYRPAPTIFTSKDPPQWYSKLKEQNASQRSRYSTVYSTGT
ncbi:progesterone-induced-blocking factor 1-like [Acanthaster planci]|uniref:Progesterone-induced-blocking factor 1-like n=1 Tax=Acanthaster planci TaxID=133434 RepID=A0A8B7YJ28_ACAPL|nr:progesterone-induced-blocking factor 1-like [Acanthaster planci]